MARKTPNGVRRWNGTGQASSVKGKKTPDTVGAGRAVTGERIAGSAPKRLDTSGGGTGQRVSGVIYNSGTEKRSTPTKRHRGKMASVSGGDASFTPSGVRKIGGLKAPRKAQQP